MVVAARGCALALLLVGCAAQVPVARGPRIDVHAPGADTALLLALPEGDARLVLDGPRDLTARVGEVAQQGFYDGAGLRVESGLVALGDGVWRGGDPSPRWLVESPLVKTLLKQGDVALPVLAHGENRDVIVGARLFVVVANGAVSTREAVVVGKVSGGSLELLKRARGGERLLRVSVGRAQD